MLIPVLQLFRIKYVELGALKCVVHYPSIVHYGSGNSNFLDFIYGVRTQKQSRRLTVK
jgi:hypothetical protein